MSVFTAITFSTFLFSQPVFFETAFGGSGQDFARSVRQISDGSIYVAGYSDDGTNGGYDFSLIKLNRYGNLLWTKYYGDSLNNFGLYMNNCTDGNFILAGETQTPSDGLDILVYKIDTSGSVLWTKQYGTSVNESATHVESTNDGGYILTGFQNDSAGSNDSYLLKINSSGNFMWDLSFGGTDNDVGMECHETPEGNLLFTGDSRAVAGGHYDVEVAKFDPSGNLIWDTILGDTLQNGCQGILITSKNQYLSYGETEIFLFSPYDFLLELLDSSGTSIWKKNIGGVNADAAFSAVETPDGGFMFTGYSSSYAPGPNEVVVFKIDSAGTLKWVRTYGNTGVDIGYEIVASNYGGYLITGKYFEGSEQYYLLHLDTAGLLTSVPDPLLINEESAVFPNPSSGVFTIYTLHRQDNHMEVFDVYGNLVFQTPINSKQQTINCGLAHGMYIYRILNHTGTLCAGKIIIQ